MPRNTDQLLPVNPIETALIDLRLNTIRPSASVTGPLIVTTACVSAIASAFLYVSTNEPAGNRWDKEFNTNVFIFLFCFGGFVTNALFNAESYLTLIKEICQPSNNKAQTNYEKWMNRSQWVVASLIGVFVTIPIWAVAKTSDAKTIVAAIFNIPINADGGYSLIESSKRALQSRREKNNTQQQQAHQLKQQLLSKLDEFIECYPSTEVTEKDSLYDSISKDNQAPSEILDTLLSYQLPERTVPTGITQSAYTALTWFVGFICLFQNIGFTSEGYQAGQELGETNTAGIILGSTFAVLNLIPSLGFSFKGNQITAKTISRLAEKRATLMQKTSPLIYNSALMITLICAVLSGGTSSEASHTVICPTQHDCEASSLKNIAAWAFNVMGYLGAACGYNLPQCLIFIDRMLELRTASSGLEKTKSQLSIINEVENLRDIMIKIPATELETRLQKDGFKEICDRHLSATNPMQSGV